MMTLSIGDIAQESVAILRRRQAIAKHRAGAAHNAIETLVWL
jgi:hypothetical protein